MYDLFFILFYFTIWATNEAQTKHFCRSRKVLTHLATHHEMILIYILSHFDSILRIFQCVASPTNNLIEVQARRVSRGG